MDTTDTAQEIQLDVEEAKKLLERHGYAFRIYGREDVEAKLDELASETDTRTFRSEIVEHVMNGQDWGDLSNKEYDDATTLWSIIMGTANDHPEWFIG